MGMKNLKNALSLIKTFLSPYFVKKNANFFKSALSQSIQKEIKKYFTVNNNSLLTPEYHLHRIPTAHNHKNPCLQNIGISVQQKKLKIFELSPELIQLQHQETKYFSKIGFINLIYNIIARLNRF
jgi:hypothetical protein